jgi:hypothetical protein
MFLERDTMSKNIVFRRRTPGNLVLLQRVVVSSYVVLVLRSSLTGTGDGRTRVGIMAVHST